MQLIGDASNTMPLRRGCKGQAVEELQSLLKDLGFYTAAIDGDFSLYTEQAVKYYQHRVFLPKDGIVGDKTWRALYTGAPVDMPELKKGSTGELVSAVQRVLKSTFDYIGHVDGDFGPITEGAVQSMQRRSNLPVTGIIEDNTWHALSKIPY